MRNYKMIIAYDGTRYKGWQRLVEDSMTIQGILENILSKEIGYAVTIDGSGRTDSGVHARGQVANVKISRKVDPIIFRDAVNAQLPEDIRIVEMELVKNGFHSRLSATGKQYQYRIDRREKPDVFMRRFTYHFPEKLDEIAMKKAAGLLIGTHDFAAFCDKKEDKSCIRTIYNIDFSEEGSILLITYTGNGFLNHMVRILTGTLVEVGNGQRTVESVKQALESGIRGDAGYTAPARGLRLEEVYYN